jgi:hypothetical protein
MGIGSESSASVVKENQDDEPWDGKRVLKLPAILQASV